MGIVYVLSTIFLIVAFMLVKKTEKILDVLSFLGITIVLYFSYNVVLCYILTFVNVPNNMIVLSLINLIIGIVLSLMIKNSKQIQKYKFDKVNCLCIIMILIVTFIAAILNFNIPFNIKYETGDPATHHLTSVIFSEEEKLLNFYEDEVYGVSQGRKIGSYVNSGIIMQIFSGLIYKIDYYKIFIAFGIFVFFLTGAIMFNILSNYANSKKGKLLALIVSIIYVLGYPFNSLLFGFEYLSMGILVLEAILLMVHYFKHEEFKFPYYLIIFALLNFELFCSYYMFVPFAYPALWIFFCIYSRKNNKKIFCKKNVLLLVITLLIPFILGYIYHLAPGIYNIFNMDTNDALKEAINRTEYLSGRGFASYGYIYVNFYSNLILLLPLTLYYLFRRIKEKKILEFDNLLLFLMILFIGLLITGLHYEKVSIYYIMKNYYALSILIFYMNFRGMMYIYGKNKILPFTLVFIYLIIIVYNLIFIKALIDKGPENEHENIFNFVEIYGVNKTIIVDRPEDYNQKEIEILRYAKENLDFENNKVEIIGNPEQVMWGYDFLRYINRDENFKKYTYSQYRLQAKAMSAHEKVGKVDYMIYLKRSIYYQYFDYLYEKTRDVLFENGEIVFQNDAGGIIKYKIEQ